MAAVATATVLFTAALAPNTVKANPFIDVPSDHWAYDAVAELAADGIIDGYGDNTFRGGRNVTRYEMAKMVAAAMAKQSGNVDNAGKPVVGSSQKDRALIDRLAAEFSDELNNLGVRVANLERNADMVKWTGEARYFYRSNRDEQADGSQKRSNTNRLELRLFPTAEVNDHWKFKARLTARDDMNTDTTGDVKITYAFAEGQYGHFTTRLGRISNYSTNDEGLVVDDYFSGAQLTFGNKLQAVLEAGRWNMNNGSNGNIYAAFAADPAANYQGLQLNYGEGKGFIGVGYRRFESDGFKNIVGYGNNEDTAGIFSVGASYRFGSSVNLSGAFAKNSDADNLSTGHSIKLMYKGANRNKPKTWGVWAAYRYVSPYVSLAPTYETMGSGNKRKGYEVGFNYAPAKNIMADAMYFDGKQLDTGRDTKTVFARARFYW